MEDSFKVRVDKVFGSLSESSSRLWSLTDEQAQKKECIKQSPSRHFDDHHTITNNSRYSNNSIVSSSDCPQNLDDDNQEDDVDNEEEEEDDDDDELDVRASIGLDSTLDFEEEEDEYDEVAIGKEKSGVLLYMKDIIDDDGPDVNTFHELPHGFNDATRDPRANHLAAKLRLEEDSEAAGGFHSSELSETSKATWNSLSNAGADITSSQDNGDGGLAILKSILKNKKRDSRSVSQSQKRVRFEDEFDTTSDTTKDQNQEASNLALTKTGDPLDTHYTLESSDDMNEESNRKAYMDVLNLTKKPDATETQSDVDFPDPPTLALRKSSMVDSESKSNKDVPNDQTSPICIALGDVQENEVTPVEEDDSPVEFRCY